MAQLLVLWLALVLLLAWVVSFHSVQAGRHSFPSNSASPETVLQVSPF